MKLTTSFISILAAVCMMLILVPYAAAAAETEVVAWPGEQNITSSELSFLDNSSGLDFHNGQLYLVDNGAAAFWILDVAEDGTLSFAEGFENGKIVTYVGDYDLEHRPDTEGITVDGDGYVYFAAERDNNISGDSYNAILKADPNAEGDIITAIRQWDITASIPAVSANRGIEAVEWISNDEVAGKLFDKNTEKPFDPSDYPDAVADGVFFAALEDNGHVYAFVLNNDGSHILISDIDSELGGAMALDYDTYENTLWVVSDDGYDNVAAKLNFNGTEEVGIVHVTPPEGLDITRNNEGFAIADVSCAVDSKRPVYRFTDGMYEGSLLIGSMDYNFTMEFPDVDEDTWYYEGIYYCAKNGYILGNADGTFNPDGMLTREQFVVMLARVVEADLTKYTENVFTDVDTASWYAPSVIWANKEGYVNGIGNGLFGVEQNITREQLATLFYRYAAKQGVNVGNKADLSAFEDGSKVGKWAADATAWAVEAKLLGSVVPGKNILSPDTSVSRAQAAKIFKSYDEYTSY